MSSQRPGAGRNAEVKGGLDIVSGGTDTHIVLVDLRPKGLTGKASEKALAAPSSPATRTACRSIRKSRRHLGRAPRLAACTTRGFGEAEFRRSAI
jgi:glycine hydroxymethyltransferase